MKYQKQQEEGEKPTAGCCSMLKRCRNFFCCSNGFYPLIVAPIVTLTCLLDVYGSLGCNFINLDIGVDPINVGWNKTSVLDFGLFYYSDSEKTNVGAPFYMEAIHPECRKFEDVFSEYFVDGDKTWKLSQVMAIVSGCGGTLATLTIWLYVFFPIPFCFLWSGILLPSVLALFLAGGSKFLLFDTEICGSALWVPFGDSASPVEAKSCTLSNDSFICILSTSLALLCVLLICMKYPKNTRNIDDKQYGDQNGIFADTDGLRTYSSISDEIDSEAQEDSIMDKRVGIKGGRSYDMDFINTDVPPDGADNVVNVPYGDKSQKIRIYNRNESTDKMKNVEDSLDMMQNGDEDRIQPKYSTGFYSRWTPPPQTEEGERTFSFRSPLKVFQKQKLISPEPRPYDEDKIHKCLAELEQSFGG